MKNKKRIEILELVSKLNAFRSDAGDGEYNTFAFAKLLADENSKNLMKKASKTNYEKLVGLNDNSLCNEPEVSKIIGKMVHALLELR